MIAGLRAGGGTRTAAAAGQPVRRQRDRGSLRPPAARFSQQAASPRTSRRSSTAGARYARASRRSPDRRRAQRRLRAEASRRQRARRARRRCSRAERGCAERGRGEPSDAPTRRARVRAALIGASQPHDAQTSGARARRSRAQHAGRAWNRPRKIVLLSIYRRDASARRRRKTLVVYPLRALANDQYEALRANARRARIAHSFARTVRSISDERAELFAALREGAWDVVLATPEFLEFHRDAFARQRARRRSSCVDEAHHLHESRHRPAYARLRAKRSRRLGDPQVLALTATAGDEAFRADRRGAAHRGWVIDPTVRENLHVVDARDTKDKIALPDATSLPATAEKGIVYCNSRAEATKVREALRKQLGDDGDVLSREDAQRPSGSKSSGSFARARCASSWRRRHSARASILPDVRHVVLYHLNFDSGEFNQQAGRAGRDGAPARDSFALRRARSTGSTSFSSTSKRRRLERLREIYRGMRALARDGVVRGEQRRHCRHR